MRDDIMSISASIDVKLKEREGNIVSPMLIIKKLLHYGWTFNDSGRVSYLPLGDSDNYDWQFENIDTQSLIAILDEKEKKGEVIGVSMTWKETNIGGSFLFFKNGEVSISLIINRKLLDNMRHTDVSWYLKRLLPVFNQEDGIELQRFSYEEY